MTLAVIVDRGVCSGSGLCARICPEVFEVVDGYSTVHSDAITEGTEMPVREAALLCPLQAISISQADGD